MENSSVFANDGGATGLMTGIYTRMFTSGGFASGGSGSISLLAGLSADELVNYNTSTDNIEFAANALTSNNGTLSSIWGECYQYIYTSNDILEGLSAPNGVSVAVSQQLTGESKFVRAFCYFYLVNLFGDVPLILTTDYLANVDVVRSPSNVVNNQIVSDLTDAQNLLSSDYSVSAGNRVRPNKWAATAMLARTYLYEQKWDSAEYESNLVISNSTLFNLTSLDSVFLANSPESIWQLLPVSSNINTNEAQNFILTAPPGNVALDSIVINAFEPGDNRFSNWVGTYSDGTNSWYFPYKYKIQASPDITEYSMVIRLAEEYLISAEAEANGAGGGLPSAINNLNIIRQRAGLSPYSGGQDKSSILNAIYHERQVELFTEWGHRWLDLKRTNRADLILSAEKPQWVPTDALYPIPLIEIKNNSKVSQNPGY